MAGDERKIITLVLIKGTNFYVVTYMSLSSLCCNIFSFHDESSLQNFKAFFEQFFLRRLIKTMLKRTLNGYFLSFSLK